MHFALACFMMAIKYEEVYPPSLEQIQSKMRLQLEFAAYIEVEFQVLRMLGYSLNLASPVQYFRSLPCELTG
jgi:hypothetical protein